MDSDLKEKKMNSATPEVAYSATAAEWLHCGRPGTRHPRVRSRAARRSPSKEPLSKHTVKPNTLDSLFG